MPPVPPGGSRTLPARLSPARSHGRLALAAILICQLMVVLDATIVNIALPDIQQTLGFSRTGLSWVLNAYALTFGGLLLLGARAGDLFGRRRVLVGGVALFIAASLAGGLTSSAGLLLAARAAQGVGAALAAPSALALLMLAFPEGAERARALALYAAVSVGGAALGLVAGGVLVEWTSWRWVFFVNVPIGIGLIALVRKVLRETPRGHGRIDLAGAALSTSGMAALVYGFVEAAQAGWSATTTVAAFTAGAVLLAGFVAVELRVATPITPMRLFANRDRSLSYVIRLLSYGGMFGVFFLLTQFLQDYLGYSPLLTGLAFVPLPASLFAATQLVVRYLLARVEARNLMAGGMLISASGALLLAELSASSTYWHVLACLVLFGAGMGLTFVPLTAASLHGVEPAHAGAASGLVNAMQQIGGALGLAVLVTVFSSATHTAGGASGAPTAHTFVTGADTAFWWVTGMLVVSALLSAVMRKQTGRPERATVSEPETRPEGEPAAA